MSLNRFFFAVIALPFLFSCTDDTPAVQAGYQSIVESQVRVITIKVTPPGESETSKTFTDPQKLKDILGVLRVNEPIHQESKVSSVISGEITIGVEDSKNNLNPRVIKVLSNGGYLEDWDYKDMYYLPKALIDKAWLEKQ